MSFIQLLSRAQMGMEAPLVTVEVHLTGGLPRFNIVGLLETTVKESRDRVRSALINSGYAFPGGRVTVNLGPAELPKEGGRYDLAIALGIIGASQQIETRHWLEYEFVGELALNGELRTISAALPCALASKQTSRGLIIPQGNMHEVSLAKHPLLFHASQLNEVCAHLREEASLTQLQPKAMQHTAQHAIDFSEIKGHVQAKRMLEIAAAGDHHALMVGPPGTGKSLLARAFPSILSPLSEQQAIESAVLHSLKGFALPQLDLCRPFRAPHHSASLIALVGGGRPIQPGEISLAHYGVLFLDELPEFDRRAIEGLRQPLEEGCVQISRAHQQLSFPAQFQLLAAMNPCPCGFLGDPEKACTCTPAAIHRYRHRLSGPLLDRLDLRILVPRVDPQVFLSQSGDTCRSAQIRENIQQARSFRQLNCDRLQIKQIASNTLLPLTAFSDTQLIQQTALNLANRIMSKKKLSPRSYLRLLRVSRTIADLAARERIISADIEEAMSLRLTFGD